MAGPERKFIDSVHRQVDPEWNLFKQCNTGIIGANGVPDYYYEGLRTATWIEYKATNTLFLPKIVDLNDQKKRYALSPLQRRWINRAFNNEVRVAVALGAKNGEALLFTEQAWESIVDVDEVRQRGGTASPSGVAHFAAGFTNCRVLVQHNKNARVQYEHASSSLHHR